MSIFKAHGVLKGNVVELEERPALLGREGARVRVMLEFEESRRIPKVTAVEKTRRAAWKRARARMERGYDLGGAPYPRREELYDRFDYQGAG